MGNNSRQPDNDFELSAFETKRRILNTIAKRKNPVKYPPATKEQIEEFLRRKKMKTIPQYSSCDSKDAAIGIWEVID